MDSEIRQTAFESPTTGLGILGKLKLSCFLNLQSGGESSSHDLMYKLNNKFAAVWKDSWYS
jgi:hypothetical protein